MNLEIYSIYQNLKILRIFVVKKKIEKFFRLIIFFKYINFEIFKNKNKNDCFLQNMVFYVIVLKSGIKSIYELGIYIII